MTPIIVTMLSNMTSLVVAAPTAIQYVVVTMAGYSQPIVVNMAWITDSLDIWVTDEGFVWAEV